MRQLLSRFLTVSLIATLSLQSIAAPVSFTKIHTSIPADAQTLIRGQAFVNVALWQTLVWQSLSVLGDVRAQVVKTIIEAEERRHEAVARRFGTVIQGAKVIETPHQISGSVEATFKKAWHELLFYAVGPFVNIGIGSGFFISSVTALWISDSSSATVNLITILLSLSAFALAERFFEVGSSRSDWNELRATAGQMLRGTWTPNRPAVARALALTGNPAVVDQIIDLPIHGVQKQFIQKQRRFVLVKGARRLEGGLLLHVEGNTYLKIGQRWISAAGLYELADLPISELAEGSLLLGNPELQSFTGIRVIQPNRALHPLPAGFAPTSDLLGFSDASYTAKQIDNAIKVLTQSNPVALAQSESLDAPKLLRWLNALLVIAHSRSANSPVFVTSMDQLKVLNQLILHDSLADLQGLSSELKTFCREIAILAMKLKMGYPEMLMREVNQEAVRSLIKQKADQKVTAIGADGNLQLVDVANDVEWDSSVMLSSEADTLRAQGVALEQYDVMTEIGIAGEGSRMLQDMFAANKMMAPLLRISDQFLKAFLQFIAQKITYVPWVFGKHSYSGISHAVAVRNEPLHTTWIGGFTTIGPLTELLGNRPVDTQVVVHSIIPDKGFDMSVTRPGGHGDLISAVVSKRDRLMDMIELGLSWRHVQGDDLGNAETGHLLAFNTLSGKSVMAATVTAQYNVYLPQLFKVRELLESGIKLTIGGREVSGIATSGGTQVVYFKEGSSLVLGAEIHRLNQAWAAISERIQTAYQTTDGQAQRDAHIEILNAYMDQIYNPIQALVVQSEKGQIPLIAIDQQRGGHLFKIGSDVEFIEKSQYDKNVRVRHSSGETFTFPQEAYMAVAFKHFNTNNFALDPLAIAANRDREIKAIYHAFLVFAQTHANDFEAIRKHRRDAETRALARMQEISPEEWMARTLAIERLAMAMYPPPVEQKGQIKLNKMAQQVAALESQLAFADITAEQIDLEVLKAAMRESAGESDEANQIRVKNEKLQVRSQRGTLQPLRLALAPSDALRPWIRDGHLRSRSLIEVPSTEFTQVKIADDYDAKLSQVANEVFGKPYFGEMTLRQRQAVAAGWWLEQAQRSGLIGTKTAAMLQGVFINIAEMSEETVGADALSLLESLRLLVAQEFDENNPAPQQAQIFKWAQALEVGTPTLENALRTIPKPDVPTKAPGTGGIFALLLKPLVSSGWVATAFGLGAALEGILVVTSASLSHGAVIVGVAAAVVNVLHHLAGVFVYDSASNQWIVKNVLSKDRTGFWPAFGQAMAASMPSLIGAFVAAGFGLPIGAVIVIGILPHLTSNVAPVTPAMKRAVDYVTRAA